LATRIDQISEIPLFCAAVILTGVLAERGRKQRADLERTTQRLTEVYQRASEQLRANEARRTAVRIGQLSAGLAHEVRTPLASIAGAAGILQHPRLEKKDAECLAIITKECQRLSRLVTHFPDFARPRTPNYQSTDVGTVIAEQVLLNLVINAVQATPDGGEVLVAARPRDGLSAEKSSIGTRPRRRPFWTSAEERSSIAWRSTGSTRSPLRPSLRCERT